jgi:hypothetical protein
MNFYARFLFYGFLILIAAGFFTNVLSGGEKVNHVTAGMWGGEHIGLDVTDEGAKIEFDCAHGSIEGLIALDANDRFDVSGVYVQEQGGPLRQGQEEGRSARYFGKIDGKSMSLTVEVTDTKEEVGTFTLELGKSPKITKCD